MTASGAGVLITFEGGEGAGKTTQIRLLAGELERQSVPYICAREPGGDAAAEAIRAILMEGGLTPRAELLLFLAARAQNTEAVLRPHLLRGAVVICDRYIDSSVAYQGVARGLGRDEVARLNGFATGGLVPDLTVLLDVDPADGLARQDERHAMEGEQIAFHRQVRQAFLDEAARADGRRFAVIDASLPKETVHAAVMSSVRPLLEARGLSPVARS